MSRRHIDCAVEDGRLAIKGPGKVNDVPDPSRWVYDVAANSAVVSVGTDHDTPVFAVTSIETWWTRMGTQRYPNAQELFITADAGGSNGYRSRVWKAELQRLADKIGVSIHVSHFPPGTSKWDKIEHRLFSLRSYEMLVNLIGNTTNRGGLVARARLDRRSYPIGRKVSVQELRALKIEPGSFRGDWNYIARPRTHDP